MKMHFSKKLLLAVLLLFSLQFMGCETAEAPQIVSKKSNLADQLRKGWKVSARSVDDDCAVLTPRELDNIWYFYADGRFSYDNGTITEDDCSGDLANVIGDWSFSTNEDSLYVVVHAKIVNGTDTVSYDPYTLLTSKIETLTADKLRLSQLIQSQDTFHEFTPVK